MTSANYGKMVNYEPPEFASDLPNIPKHRVKLAMLPTPIHEWNLPDVPPGFEVYIKRDDLTGNLLSGNKIRKLEFLLGDALAKGCESVTTCGTVKSNHCRATAVAAKLLGLDCHLILRSKSEHRKEAREFQNPGNILPSMFVGSKYYFVPWDSVYDQDVYERQVKLAAQIEKSTGKAPYYIPLGGSNVVGSFGYIEAWKEMLEQNILQNFDDIVVASGSAGTVAGLCIANYLTGQKVKIHAINVKIDKEYAPKHVNIALQEQNLSRARAEDLVDFVDGYAGEGYPASSKTEQSYIKKIAEATGIFCDHVYTGKAVMGMLEELKTNPSRFKGNRVLFVHTGGSMGLFDGTFQSCLSSNFDKTAFTWENPGDEPKPL